MKTPYRMLICTILIFCLAACGTNASPESVSESETSTSLEVSEVAPPPEPEPLTDAEKAAIAVVQQLAVIANKQTNAANTFRVHSLEALPWNIDAHYYMIKIDFSDASLWADKVITYYINHYVKSWFIKQFPDYKELPDFTSENLSEPVVPAPLPAELGAAESEAA